MHPVCRTVNYYRGIFLNDLEDWEREKREGLQVEIARRLNFFPSGEVFHNLWSKYASLLGGDEFVLNAAPGNAAACQRSSEVD